jgi:hypothetical protein
MNGDRDASILKTGYESSLESVFATKIFLHEAKCYVQYILPCVEKGVYFSLFILHLAGSLQHGTIMGKEDYFRLLLESLLSPSANTPKMATFFLPFYRSLFSVYVMPDFARGRGGGEGEPKQKTANCRVFLLIRVPKVFVSDKCTLPKDFDNFKHGRGYGLVSYLRFFFR